MNIRVCRRNVLQGWHRLSTPLLGLRRALPASLATVGLALGFLAGNPSTAQAQSDDFNDGNDLGWIRYDPIGSHPQLPDIATYTLANGTYRIRTAPSPAPGSVGPSRAGALRTNVYSDFYVTVDLVDWDESLQQSVGILARVNEVGLGTTDGYVLTYNFLGKDIDITRFSNEDPAAPNGANLSLVGADDLTLEKGKAYRMVFYGQGTTLGARIFELPNLDTPLLDVTATDATYASGLCGLLVYDNSDTASLATDTTFDNYFATNEEPPKLEIVDFGFGLVNVRWPGRAAAFKLESSSTLAPNSWTPVDEAQIDYFLDLDRYVHQPDTQVGPRFYRLRKP